MPDFIEGLTDIQEDCDAVFAVVEGPDDCVSYAVALLDGGVGSAEPKLVLGNPVFDRVIRVNSAEDEFLQELCKSWQ
jgi:hypothetical protein